MNPHFCLWTLGTISSCDLRVVKVLLGNSTRTSSLSVLMDNTSPMLLYVTLSPNLYLEIHRRKFKPISANGIKKLATMLLISATDRADSHLERSLRVFSLPLDTSVSPTEKKLNSYCSLIASQITTLTKWLWCIQTKLHPSNKHLVSAMGCFH